MMNRECDNTIMLQCDNAAMPECHRAWSIEQGARGKGQAAGFGWRHSRTIVPLEKGGGDAGAGGLNTGNLINDYRLTIDDFRIEEMKNIQYRIRNHQSGNEGMTAMLQCENATMQEWVFALKGQVISAQGNALGWRRPRTIVPLEKGGGDFGAGGLKFYNSLFLIAYFLFSENVKYRIRNHQSGNEEASCKLATTYPFPNPEISGRDRQLQTSGRREACQRATHLTTLVNTPVKTTPTGLTTLSGWATLSGCGKNEIQFSIDKDLPYYSLLTGGKARRMEGREFTVIHRAQAVRACLPPFLPALTKNGFTAFFRHGSFFNNN